VLPLVACLCFAQTNTTHRLCFSLQRLLHHVLGPRSLFRSAIPCITRRAWLQHLALAGLPIDPTHWMVSLAGCWLRASLCPHRWPGHYPFGPCTIFLLPTSFT